jgi:hypothetical protein
MTDFEVHLSLDGENGFLDRMAGLKGFTGIP